MTTTHHVRHRAAATAAVLVASLLPVLVAGAPAHADAGCTSEQPTNPTPVTMAYCDDSSAPETTMGATSPTPNGRGYIKVDHVSFSFSGAYTDADADPITYQCQFGTATQPVEASWEACNGTDGTSASYGNLQDSGALPYRFFVRAVDSVDNAITVNTACAVPEPFCTQPATDTPDYDESPATATVRVDTMTPTTYVFLQSKTYEVYGDDSTNPMVGSPTVQVRLASNEGDADHPVKYACTLDDASVECADGITTLTKVGPGRHRFEAAATDQAGNTDPTPDSVVFYSPRNLTGGAPWRTVRQGGYYAGDFLQSDQVGAQLTAPGKNVRVLRLIAPAGPQLGKVEVRIGHSIWRTVNLAATTYERFHIYKVRGAYDPLVSGTIRIRVKSVPRNGFVRVDAVYTRQ